MKKFLIVLCCLLCTHGAWADGDDYLDPEKMYQQYLDEMVDLDTAYAWCTESVKYAKAHKIHFEINGVTEEDTAVCDYWYNKQDKKDLAYYAIACARKVVHAKEALEYAAKSYFTSKQSYAYLVKNIDTDIDAECSISNNYCVINVKLIDGSYLAHCITGIAKPEFICSGDGMCILENVHWGISLNKYSQVPDSKHLTDFDANCNKLTSDTVVNQLK